ncbi:hypothetical protein NL676_010574 [Syzygium grande]|nr:hypothetical protein NL676_010574 [Syzygium grande]
MVGFDFHNALLLINSLKVLSLMANVNIVAVPGDGVLFKALSFTGCMDSIFFSPKNPFAFSDAKGCAAFRFVIARVILFRRRRILSASGSGSAIDFVALTSEAAEPRSLSSSRRSVFDGRQ